MIPFSFLEWHDSNIISEGPRTIGPATSTALEGLIGKLDAEINSIEQQVKQLWNRHSELNAKKERIIKGMGVGNNSQRFINPNDYMSYYDKEVGRRPDMPAKPSGNGHPGGYPIDFGSTKQQNRRKGALRDASAEKSLFGSNAAFNLYKQLSRVDPGTYPVPHGVSPKDAKNIVQQLIGGNADYEEIYSYDPKSNTIYVGDTSDI